MLGSIAFTWVQGTDLDNNAKQWRLVADVLNDLAIFVDLLSPLAPQACVVTQSRALSFSLSLFHLSSFALSLARTRKTICDTSPRVTRAHVFSKVRVEPISLN
jgi:hypothetical protein